jgi:NADPH-dependent ferric siderophore reductase
MSTFPISTAEPRIRDVVRHDLRRRTITLIDRTPLTGSLVRFRFGGADLAGFASFGPEDHIKVFFPVAGTDEFAGRDYTPSEFRPVGGSSGPELDLDIVVHGDAGPATAWASKAAVGDSIDIGGPRGSRLAPAGFRNAVLFADATGMPALRRWIRAFAGNTPVSAVLFGSDLRLSAYLDAAELTAATPQLAPTGPFDLLEAAESQDIDADTFVWAAGESTVLVPVRRWLKGDLGLPKQNLSLHGYWRSGEAGLDHHAPLDPTDPD